MVAKFHLIAQRKSNHQHQSRKRGVAVRCLLSAPNRTRGPCVFQQGLSCPSGDGLPAHSTKRRIPGPALAFPRPPCTSRGDRVSSFLASFVSGLSWPRRRVLLRILRFPSVRGFRSEDQIPFLDGALVSRSVSVMEPAISGPAISSGFFLR